MELIGAFVRGPAVLALILCVLALEAVLFSLLAQRRAHAGRRHHSPVSPLRGTLANLAAGAFLVFAMLASALDAPWGWNAGCLTGAFLAHLVDLRDRW